MKMIFPIVEKFDPRSKFPGINILRININVDEVKWKPGKREGIVQIEFPTVYRLFELQIEMMNMQENDFGYKKNFKTN